jgi:hypothetical protein
MKKNCPICQREFETKWKFQKYCSEDCRVTYNSKARYGESFKEERLKEYLAIIEKSDKRMGEWMKDHPVTILPGGEISIFGVPKNNIKEIYD